MADMLLSLDRNDIGPTGKHESVENLKLDYQSRFWLYGSAGTFCHVTNGNDSIASIGYVCTIDGETIKETLSNILVSFDELQIRNLKKKLIGQYVLMIKKNNSMYFFSDFLGGKNIFYSDNGLFVSTSFAQIEDILQTSSTDFDIYKVFEFLSVRHVLYPTWLGNSTEHKHIKWLLPYEYLVINLLDKSFRIGSIVYSVDNRKQSDRSLLSDELISILKAIINRKEYKDSMVSSGLTGGRDSRLISVIVAGQFQNTRFRTCLSDEDDNSINDMKVAKKVAKILGVPLDIYQYQKVRDEELFYKNTEGFAPAFNHVIAPLMHISHTNSLSFGGVFGTELFLPIRWKSIDEYIRTKIRSAQKYVLTENNFWDYFYELLKEEFQRIKKQFELRETDDRDYIRIFQMFNTARYASFILSGSNRSGYHLEPYGNYAVFDLALRVAPEIWGNHRKLRGDALIQKSAMLKLNPAAGKVITYSSYRPMLPLSLQTTHLYIIGYIRQLVDVLKVRFSKWNKGLNKTELTGGYYLSNGWAKPFIERSIRKYGLTIDV